MNEQPVEDEDRARRYRDHAALGSVRWFVEGAHQNLDYTIAERQEQLIGDRLDLVGVQEVAVGG